MYESYLYQQFIEEVSDFGWDQIKAMALAEPEKDYYGNLTGSYYLGSNLNLAPSGKYYQPFACSNVDPCPHCKGSGKLTNLNFNMTAWAASKEMVESVRKNARLLYNRSSAGWPDEVLNFTKFVQEQADACAPTLPCPFCGGTGSEEAFHDTLFWEALDEVAEAHDMYISSGDGDGCDVFACVSIETEEEAA